MEGMEGMEAVAHKTPALKQQRGRAQKAFSLIEAAIVLAVVGGVIGTIWVSAATMYENHKVNKTVEGIFTTAKNVQRVLSARDAEVIGNSAHISNSLYEQFFPKDWQHGDPFGNYPFIMNYSGPRFLIILRNVPPDICVKLTVKASSVGAMAYDNVSGLNAMTRPGRADIYNFPISIQTAETFCASPSTEMLSFGFGYTRRN